MILTGIRGGGGGGGATDDDSSTISIFFGKVTGGATSSGGNSASHSNTGCFSVEIFGERGGVGVNLAINGGMSEQMEGFFGGRDGGTRSVTGVEVTDSCEFNGICEGSTYENRSLSRSESGSETPLSGTDASLKVLPGSEEPETKKVLLLKCHYY